MNVVPPDKLEELSQSLLWPMNLLSAYCRRTPPPFSPLFAQQIPEPYRQLLVHERNMTPTLEDFHGDTIHIERLNVLTKRNERSREVILRLDTSEKVVEYGASRIFVDTLPPQAVTLIKEGRVPLGTILTTYDCKHTVEVCGFFKIPSTQFFQNIFSGHSDSPLYGRRNALVAPNGTTLAEVCEILPPMSRPGQLGINAEINTLGV